MRFSLVQFGLFMCVIAIGAAFAEEPKPPQAPATNAVANPPEQRTDWKGTLSAAPTNAAAGVVAVLKLDKSHKPNSYLLRTEDPVLATRMQELAKSHKGSTVVLSGALDPDGANIMVTGIYQLPKERKPERR